MTFLWCLKSAGVLLVGGLLTMAEGLAQQPTISDAGLTKSIRPPRETNAEPQRETPEALFLPKVNQLTQLDEAYLDTFSILKEDNTCSAFYGGPSAIQVLNQLKQQLKPVYLGRTRRGENDRESNKGDKFSVSSVISRL